MALYYGEASPANLVGEGKLSSFSSTSQMRVRGMPFTLRMSQMSGSITLESPVTGKMKLKPNPMTGTGLGMYDASGNKVAKIRSGGGFGDKQLEIYVPGDGMFIEVVLLSFMTAKMLNKIVGDAEFCPITPSCTCIIAGRRKDRPGTAHSRADPGHVAAMERRARRPGLPVNSKAAPGPPCMHIQYANEGLLVGPRLDY
ncbi:hypothetical protein ACCO45_008785 [Purpureocillium lilacinum]|uniref:Uncharacterized protein n=1 Tax=Purpureocillium lilacinum TaxID=33203 RepID=A0ACC4DI24_PURLI